MIYTRFGIKIKITGKTENGSHFFCESIEDAWQGWRDWSHGITADGGSKEIQAAVDAAPVREMPPEPQWKGRLRGVLDGR